MSKIAEIRLGEILRQKMAQDQLRRDREAAITNAIGEALDEVKLKPGRRIKFTTYHLTIIASGYVPIYAEAQMRGPDVVFMVRRGWWPWCFDSYFDDFRAALVAAKK